MWGECGPTTTWQVTRVRVLDVYVFALRFGCHFAGDATDGLYFQDRRYTKAQRVPGLYVMLEFGTYEIPLFWWLKYTLARIVFHVPMLFKSRLRVCAVRVSCKSTPFSTVLRQAMLFPMEFSQTTQLSASSGLASTYMNSDCG